MEYTGGVQSDVYIPIGDKYAGKSIFVTGCTGFLGKVFVEKILYRCPKVEKIYVLIRETQDATATERLKKMLDSTLFKRLKDERPQDLEKVVAVSGDITKPNLGINRDAENLILDNVSMVFHFAATVKFNEPLQIAVRVNVEGTRNVLELSRRMKDIEVFLHISTAFSNSPREELDEVVYPSPIPLSDVSQIMAQKKFTGHQTTKLLSGYPNTYTLTKGITENLVAQYNDVFSTVIVRPSIVASSKDEPMIGWIDNWYGATALVAATGNGVNRILLGDGSNNIDLIPVDYVANLIIVAAARSKWCKSTKVFNSCSSGQNPITLSQLAKIVVKDSLTVKSNVLPMPSLVFTEFKWMLKIVSFILHTLPACLVDCILILTGKKPRFMKLLSRIQAIHNALAPFTSRTWIMRARNTSALHESLARSDQMVFACDPCNINWNTYIPTYCCGIRKFMLNNKK